MYRINLFSTQTMIIFDPKIVRTIQKINKSVSYTRIYYIIQKLNVNFNFSLQMQNT